MSKKPTSVSVRYGSWKYLNVALLVNSFLVLIRSIVRAVEFIQGYDGEIASHEWYLYIFDGLPMFLLVLIFIVAFPLINILEYMKSLFKRNNQQDLTAPTILTLR